MVRYPCFSCLLGSFAFVDGIVCPPVEEVIEVRTGRSIDLGSGLCPSDVSPSLSLSVFGLGGVFGVYHADRPIASGVVRLSRVRQRN